MEVESRPVLEPTSFWKTTFSDLESTGILQGLASTGIATAPVYDAQFQLPLTPVVVPGGLPATRTALLAAWAVVLTRHTSTPDVTFYSSFGEDDPWTAPVRVVVPAKSNTRDWMPLLDEHLREIAEAGPVPGPLLAQAKEEGHDRSAPAFVVIAPQANTFPPREDLQGPLLVIARLDLSILELHYDASRFGEDDIRALGDHINLVFAAMAETPQMPLGKLPLLTGEERKKILDVWNDSTVPFAANTGVHQAFEEQVERTPDAVALVFCDQQWTYRELNAQADAIAARLQAAGVKRGSLVAVCLHRSLELMATLFGVLKAGAAYVPLDPAYPLERLAFMIEDSAPVVIAVSKPTAESVAASGCALLFVDAPENAGRMTPLTDLQTSDAAYVLYTSGSTGKPKGVVVTHRNVSNFFTAMDGVIGANPGVWLAVTSINFDISVFELFWTLARGFRVVLQEEGQWVSATDSNYSLPQQIRRHGVTHLQCTPSLASMLICDADSVSAIRPLRCFMLGGEPLPLDLARRMTDLISGDVYNLYGPTETTVWSASQKVPRDPDRILIGRPVANNRLYVLDAERELVPVGSKGELYIGGDGLAREYLNRPDITAERFIEHAFSPDRRERLYATGDVVRQLPDGRLEFMGRSDNQIKIRGVRIELGEIEMVLREHPEIRDAIVLVLEDQAHGKRLVGYVIPKAGLKPNAPAVQQWLGTKLPKAVVPGAIVFLTEFPKTPNGKLDRRALPKPDHKSAPVAGHETASDLERQIVAIWIDALGVESIGLDDRFFDLGGHSLLMVEVHDKLRDRAGFQVPLLDLFQYPTVRTLAEHLRLQSRQIAEKKTASGKLRSKLRLQSLAGRNIPVRPRASTKP